MRRESVGIGSQRPARAPRRRRTLIGTSHRPKLKVLVSECGMQRRQLEWRRTSRMPTHDSAILTSKLSCAHFRALCASFAARSARFCCRWIWTIRATLFTLSAPISVGSFQYIIRMYIRIQASLMLAQHLKRLLRLT